MSNYFDLLLFANNSISSVAALSNALVSNKFTLLSVLLLNCVWQMATLERNAFILSATLAYISFCVNPFIYASRYEVFRRYLKQMLNTNSVTPSNIRPT